MGEQNGNPPIDFNQAIPIGDKIPIPDAANCVKNMMQERAAPEVVAAMALVGILYQLEQRTEQETEKLELVGRAESELGAATDAAFAELRDRLDAHEILFDKFPERAAELLQKLDTYRERLEGAEAACKALLERGNRLELELERRGVFGTQDPNKAGK